MDITKFKKILKDTIKEAFHEELRDLLLEAIKGGNSREVLQENLNSSKGPSREEIRGLYNTKLKDLGYNEIKFDTNSLDDPNRIPFIPIPGGNSINGALPPGEVGLDLISHIMNSK